LPPARFCCRVGVAVGGCEFTGIRFRHGVLDELFDWYGWYCRRALAGIDVEFEVGILQQVDSANRARIVVPTHVQ
jgi:hypothetical protein